MRHAVGGRFSAHPSRQAKKDPRACAGGLTFEEMKEYETILTLPLCPSYPIFMVFGVNITETAITGRSLLKIAHSAFAEVKITIPIHLEDN
jgi:hypothetical protein